MTDNLLKLIEKINADGWQVSTLNQYAESGIWAAAIRKRGNFPSGFAQARDPYTALKLAWDTKKEPKLDRVPLSFNEAATDSTPAAVERVRIRR